MKKLAFILATILIFCCLGCVQTGIAFAASETAFDNTYVLDDLKESQIAGEEFNPAKYGYSKERQAQVITFAEYGFNYDSDKQDYYGLYVYVYNPSGQAIGKERNKITLSTVYENDKAVDYDPFDLILLSVSEDKYANLFYKFKVANVSKILTRVSVNTSLRRYDVGEIELNFGGTNSEAFEVGNYYEYSGFAKGCGADVDAESSLTCKSDNIETLKLDVKSTYYRYNNGVTTQSNLSSVYFGVPTSTIETYGKLQQIKANWFETRTEQQVVLTDKSLYDGLLPYLATSTEDDAIPMDTIYMDNGYKPKYFLGGESKYKGVGSYTSLSSHYYNWYFDGKYHTYDPNKNWENGNGNNYINELLWLFYSSDGKISAKEVLEQASDVTDILGTDNLLLDKYYSNLFAYEVDENRQYGWQGADGSGIVIDADSAWDINGFTAGNKLKDWFVKTFYKDIEDTPLKDISPIYPVKDTDIVGSRSEIAEKLLIDENDVADFIQVYNQNKLAGKTTFLFRFAVTDFDTHPLYGVAYKVVQSSYTGYEVGYISQQTAFLDFDIIWLMFTKEGVETVIPTVSSPIDIVSGLTPPLEETDTFEWLKNFIAKLEKAFEWLVEHWWVLIVGAVAIGLLIWLIIAIIKKGIAVVFKVIGSVLWFILKWIVFLPFTLLYYGIKKAKE